MSVSNPGISSVKNHCDTLLTETNFFFPTQRRRDSQLFCSILIFFRFDSNQTSLPLFREVLLNSPTRLLPSAFTSTISLSRRPHRLIAPFTILSLSPLCHSPFISISNHLISHTSDSTSLLISIFSNLRRVSVS
ncbi:unnamed protein product [Vicia faba]|uniref:Uncharacterized protein n=1 Tax=Vicia faba TaxID=3906 RepID=A0AAV1ASW3_VICFA|nr:unnamed protein product [Vicia faba]